jgi:hypothetical protein
MIPIRDELRIRWRFHCAVDVYAAEPERVRHLRLRDRKSRRPLLAIPIPLIR